MQALRESSNFRTSRRLLFTAATGVMVSPILTPSVLPYPMVGSLVPYTGSG
ncbi:hypothetical protein D3C71_2241940 [compost metagenome]